MNQELLDLLLKTQKMMPNLPSFHIVTNLNLLKESRTADKIALDIIGNLYIDLQEIDTTPEQEDIMDELSNLYLKHRPQLPKDH